MAELPEVKMVCGNRHGFDATAARFNVDGGRFTPCRGFLKSDEFEREVSGKAGAGEGIRANGGKGDEPHRKAGEQPGCLGPAPRG
eukprot:12915530-Heterocapsa_arctica.AAC.1